MAEPKKDKNGKWKHAIKFKDSITNEWKTKRFTGSTKKEAKEKEFAFRKDLEKNELDKNIGLIAFYEVWMETFKKGKVSDSRYLKIELVRNNLMDFFGDKQTLRGVNKLNYQKFINWLGNEKGLAKETVSNRNSIVRSMFLEAYDMGYVRINPTRNIKISGQEPKKISNATLSMADLQALKTQLMSEPDSNANLFILAQLLTGARYQEIAALKWEDIDFDNNQIHINKALEYAVEIRLKEPKSKAGYRSIDVDSELMKLLKRHKIAQSRLMIAMKLRNQNNFVFVNNTNGLPISNSFVNGWIKKVCERANIPRISSHSLRHARTDFLILSGADPLYVKNQLGHEDYNTTLKHYASLNDEIREKSKAAVKQLEKEIL